MGKSIQWNNRTIAFLAGIVIGILILSYVLRRALILDDDPSILTFSLVHFSGYLFFIISPVEILFVHMAGLEHEALELVGLAVCTALAAQLIDYGVGYAFSHVVIHRFIGDRRYRKYEGKIDRYGGITIFIFNLFPLSSPIVALVAGMIRYKLRWVLWFSFVGLMLKYMVLFALFQ